MNKKNKQSSQDISDQILFVKVLLSQISSVDGQET